MERRLWGQIQGQGVGRGHSMASLTAPGAEDAVPAEQMNSTLSLSCPHGAHTWPRGTPTRGLLSPFLWPERTGILVSPCWTPELTG